MGEGLFIAIHCPPIDARQSEIGNQKHAKGGDMTESSDDSDRIPSLPNR